MNRAIFRNCFKSFVFDGKSPLINPENISSLPLNRTAVTEVRQISGFFYLLETINIGAAEPFIANFRGCYMEDEGRAESVIFFIFIIIVLQKS